MLSRSSCVCLCLCVCAHVFLLPYVFRYFCQIPHASLQSWHPLQPEGLLFCAQARGVSGQRLVFQQLCFMGDALDSYVFFALQ